MNPVTIGIIGIVLLVIIFLLRMPVGFAMAFVGLIGFSCLVSTEAGLSILARDVFHIFSSYSLTVIPMFVLMGSLASASGMSKRLYDASYSLLGRLRGGLAIATVAGCAGFAAICGSTNATAAAMGKVALIYYIWDNDRAVHRQTFLIRYFPRLNSRYPIHPHYSIAMYAQP